LVYDQGLTVIGTRRTYQKDYLLGHSLFWGHDLDQRRERSVGEAVAHLPNNAPKPSWGVGVDVRNQPETIYLTGLRGWII